MTEKLAEQEQPKNKTKFLHSPAVALQEVWWPWLRGDPELLSLMTSAEQTAGRAALVVLIKSENGQNTSNAQSVDPSLAHTHVLHVTGTGHLTLHVLGSVPSVGTLGRKIAPLGLRAKISSLIPL